MDDDVRMTGGFRRLQRSSEIVRDGDNMTIEPEMLHQSKQLQVRCWQCSPRDSGQTTILDRPWGIHEPPFQHQDLPQSSEDAH